MYFSLDLGGTNLRICWSEGLGNDTISLKNSITIQNNNNFELDFTELIKIIASKSNNNVDGISLGIAGTINEGGDDLKSSNNLSDWENRGLSKLLSDKFNCKVFLKNDATMAALGEAIYGIKFKETFLYVTWGTGIGGCLVEYKYGNFIANDLNWYKYFEVWEEACGGGNSIENFGKSLKDINDNEWEYIIKVFIEEAEKTSKSLQVKNIILGGGVTEKREDKVLIIKKLLSQKQINISKSKLGESSGIYGGFALHKNL